MPAETRHTIGPIRWARVKGAPFCFPSAWKAVADLNVGCKRASTRRFLSFVPTTSKGTGTAVHGGGGGGGGGEGGGYPLAKAKVEERTIRSAPSAGNTSGGVPSETASFRVDFVASSNHRRSTRLPYSPLVHRSAPRHG